MYICVDDKYVSHHLSSNGILAAEVGEGHDASELGRLVVHGRKLDQRRQGSTVAQLLSALLLCLYIFCRVNV